MSENNARYLNAIARGIDALNYRRELVASDLTRMVIHEGVAKPMREGLGNDTMAVQALSDLAKELGSRSPSEELKELPKEAILCGIKYNITVHDGLVIFEESICMSGHHTRMVFERPKDSGWYLQFSDTNNSLYVPHVLTAYALIEGVYGGTFDVKKEV